MHVEHCLLGMTRGTCEADDSKQPRGCEPAANMAISRLVDTFISHSCCFAVRTLHVLTSMKSISPFLRNTSQEAPDEPGASPSSVALAL